VSILNLELISLLYALPGGATFSGNRLAMYVISIISRDLNATTSQKKA